MKHIFKTIKEAFKDLHGAPLAIAILCIAFVLITIIGSCVLFIFKGSSQKRERPLTPQEENIKIKRDKVEQELGAKKNKYGEVTYDQDKLLNYAYSTDGAPEIDDATLEKLDIFAKDNMQNFNFNQAIDGMLSESKNYDTSKSQKYNATIRPLIDDLVLAAGIEDSYMSDKELTEDNLGLIQDDTVYFYALMALDPDYRCQYTIDKNSISATISRDTAKSLKEKLVIIEPVQEETKGAVYDYAKNVLPYDFDVMKKLSFSWQGHEFDAYFVKHDKKRDFIGYYDKDLSNPSGITTVGKWENLVKEKREMRDPATSNWQEGGPDASLMPRPDLTEEDQGNFGTGEYENRPIIPKGPQEEAQWPEELN